MCQLSQPRSSFFLALALTLGTAQMSAAQPSPEAPAERAILTGIDVLERDDFALLRGKTVGLITNHTGVNRDGISTASLMHHHPAVTLRTLFSPEHGFAGQLDQKIIGDAQDAATGLTVISLYGESRRPPADSLQGLDAVVFDIQDIGTRFYTYISTMGHAMHAAAEQGVEFVVLDRPNPINGLTVAGPVLDDGLQSFVGYHTIAVQHGMTVGELARMLVAEQQIDLKLTIVPLQNWQRADYYDATGLMWINPSPNMRNLHQAVLYPGVGLLEATNLSVGRGTDSPFEVLGAPWIDGRRLAAALNGAGLPGVRFVPIGFRPESSKFAGEDCQGVHIIVTDRKALASVKTGLTIAVLLRQLFPEDWDTKHLNHLLADDAVCAAILAGQSAANIENSYQQELAEFVLRRAPFLLY